jgi:quercetin dioxygenase-like cupin family protein
MEIVRFGPGHRRPGGPEGSHGVADQVLWSDDRAHVSELAFSRRAFLRPQTSPHVSLFVVVSGGGWVQVADERVGINHGEAVTWPAGVVHGAWTDGSEMRVLLVELTGDGHSSARLAPGTIVEGVVAEERVEPARGSLAPRPVGPGEHDLAEGEPW